jgi:hypothetical protein
LHPFIPLSLQYTINFWEISILLLFLFEAQIHVDKKIIVSAFSKFKVYFGQKVTKIMFEKSIGPVNDDCLFC